MSTAVLGSEYSSPYYTTVPQRSEQNFQTLTPPPSTKASPTRLSFASRLVATARSPNSTPVPATAIQQPTPRNSSESAPPDILLFNPSNLTNFEYECRQLPGCTAIDISNLIRIHQMKLHIDEQVEFVITADPTVRRKWEVFLDSEHFPENLRLEIFENRIIVYGPPSILHEMLNPYFSDHPPLVPLRNAGQAGWKLKQGKKVPDYSFFEPLKIGNSKPKKARQLWPTIIFEVADSQSGKNLRQACMRWITESPKGSLKTVVGIDLSRTADSSFQNVIVTTYRLSWRSKAPPTGWIDAGVQSGRLSLYFHEEESTVYDSTGSPQLTRGSLALFEADVYHQPLQGAEIAIEINFDDFMREVFAAEKRRKEVQDASSDSIDDSASDASIEAEEDERVKQRELGLKRKREADLHAGRKRARAEIP